MAIHAAQLGDTKQNVFKYSYEDFQRIIGKEVKIDSLLIQSIHNR